MPRARDLIIGVVLALCIGSCTAQVCTEQESAVCHELAFCDSGVCSCDVGLIGDGVGEVGCNRTGWTLRFNLVISPNAPLTDSNKMVDFERFADQYASALTDNDPYEPSWLVTSMVHSVTILDDGRKLLTVDAVFSTQSEAEQARERLIAFIDAGSARRANLTQELLAYVSYEIPDTVPGVVMDAGTFPTYGSANSTISNRSGWDIIGEDADDQFYATTLPFPFDMAGRQLQYDAFWVTSNSLFVFDSTTSGCCSPSVNSPSQLSLHVGGGDTSLKFSHFPNAVLMGKRIVENGVEGYVYRFEGGYCCSVDLGTNIWETTFFADNTLRIAHLTYEPGYYSAKSKQQIYGIADGAAGRWLAGGTSILPQGSALVFEGSTIDDLQTADVLLALGSCPRAGSDTGVFFLDPESFPTYGPSNESAGRLGWEVVGTNCDDCYYATSLPFQFCLGGKPIDVNDFWVTTNSQFLFEVARTGCCSSSVSYPSQLSLLVGGGDTSTSHGMASGAILRKLVVEDGVTAMVYRFEGGYCCSDSYGTNIWEVTFFSDNTLRIAHLDWSEEYLLAQRPYGVANGGEEEWILGGDATVDPGFAIPRGGAILFSNEISRGAPLEVDSTLFGRSLYEENLPVDARVYTWVAPTTSAALQILPTGMDVESVTFQPTCSSAGCWVLDIIYTTGEDNFNTLYLPNAVGDDTLSYDFDYGTTSDTPWSTWDKSAEDTYQPSNFPCGTASYDPSEEHDKSENRVAYPAPPNMATMCCIPEFLDLYRPLQSFNDFFVEHKLMTVTKEACDAGFVHSFARPGYTGPVAPVGPYTATAPIAVACTGNRAADMVWSNTVNCYNLEEAFGAVMHGNYPSSESSSWMVVAPGQKISLKFNFLMTERSFDFAKWASGDWGQAFELETCSGYMLVSFSADSSISSVGLGFEYWVSDDVCGGDDEGADAAVIPSDQHPLFSGFRERNGISMLKGGPVNSFTASAPPAPAVINPTSAFVPMPPNLLTGAFRGMPGSWVEFVTVVDPYIKQFRARVFLDEVELRQRAGMLRGTVGVEHTVDTFIGIANFKPSGLKFLDSFAMQVNVHLEKTSFFSVSTHGTNQYTFLEYVNMRLVSILWEDRNFAGNSTGIGMSGDANGDDEAGSRFVRTNSADNVNYIQVTFTLGDQYTVNNNPIADKYGSGLIPLDSVRVGRGTFLSDASMEHVCQEYELAEDASNNDQMVGLAVGRVAKSDFDDAVAQDCGPQARMCSSPSSIPDSFVSFNIPLGQMVFDGQASNDLSNNIFVDFVVNALEPTASGTPNSGGDPKQLKTTLTASMPIVTGGVNVFCDGVTAKTDLKDVANADLIIGTAATATELTRLRIIENVASTDLAEVPSTQIDTASIESALMSLVLHGNESYFSTGASNTGGYSLELDDLITVHLMEDGNAGSVVDGVSSNSKETTLIALLNEPADDNSDSNGIDTNGYKLNGAFRFDIARDQGIAKLEPTAELLAVCPFNPPRPAAGNAELESCIMRRDVRSRRYPARTGAQFPTAMEIFNSEVMGNGLVNSWVLGAEESVLSQQVVSPDSDPCPGNNADFSKANFEDSGYACEAGFMTSILGDSEYSRKLAKDFVAAIRSRYDLNGRYTRAYWINPGYEWTPTQTAGASLFQVSQKIYLFALITLDENWTRRRMLLQTDADPTADSGSGTGGAKVEFPVTPTSMLASSFNVPEDKVARFEVELQLTRVEACMSTVELQNAIRATMEDYLSSTASTFRTAQITRMTVDKGDEDCSSRRRALRADFSSATAKVQMLVVFVEDAEATFNQKAFVEMAGVNAINADPNNQVTIDDGFKCIGSDCSPIGAGAPPSSSSSSSSSSSNNTALIAGICGAVGGVLVAAVAGALWMRSRNQEVAMQGTVHAISVEDLKAQLEEEC